MTNGWTDELVARKIKENPDLGVTVTNTPQNVVEAKSDRVRRQSSSQGRGSYKYHAVRTVYGGRMYPSKKQAQDAANFYLKKQAGLIKGVLEEVPFRLPGRSVHRVDFGIIELNDVITWYESKGRDLPMGKLKRRQTEELYHIKIMVI